MEHAITVDVMGERFQVRIWEEKDEPESGYIGGLTIEEAISPEGDRYTEEEFLEYFEEEEGHEFDLQTEWEIHLEGRW